MCAIGGIFLKSGQAISLRSLLEAMVMIQNHRGPDASGVWLSNYQALGLCHNRLSILDLTPVSNQPMHSIDGRFTIVFNGEIFNFLELRQRLISHGHRFYSQGDTEVLLEAYRHWGEGMLEHLRGMFAFAIFDHAEGSLFCARDRVGEKPFIYAETPEGFVFASEIPAVRHIPGVDTSHDPDSIAAMLLHNLRHIPDPHTAYRGIKRLRAGHAMRIRQGKLEKHWRYWAPTPTTLLTTPLQLRATLEESVALRMRADVPVGALLSGGIDSSAIVALMQRHSTQPIHTYALGFDEDDEDLRRARQIATQLGTQHREFYFSPDEQWKIFNYLICKYGEPIMLLPLIHTYTLCQAIQDDGIKVVLTGNGADELFYGYTGHIRTLQISRWLDYVAPFRSLLAPLKHSQFGWIAANPGSRKAAFYSAIAKSSWSRFLSNDAMFTLVNRTEEELRYWGQACPSNQYIDESNFVGLMVENTHSVTTAGDLPAMAASIEIRSPFLDQEIIAFALATPPELKIPDIRNQNWLKAILRDAVNDLVPESLLKAPKRGFGMGIQEVDVLRGPWRQHVEEMFSGLNDVDGLLSKKKIKKQWNRFLNGHAPASPIAKIISIQTWLKTL